MDYLKFTTMQSTMKKNIQFKKETDKISGDNIMTDG